MSGNVWEWTSDCSVKGESDVRRHCYLGGSLLDSVGDFVRSLSRYFLTTVYQGSNIGFRLAQDL